MMGKLQKDGPFSSCVKNPQHFDFAGTYTIRDDIRRSRNDEFACSQHPPRTADRGV